MRKFLLLAVSAVTLAGCGHVAAIQACQHEYPKTTTQDVLGAFGLIGGLASLAVDDPNKQGRDACIEAARHDQPFDPSTVPAPVQN